MTASTIKTLCESEYDFAAIDSDLADLANRLRSCRAESPAILVAIRQLATIRRMLRTCLNHLDEDVTAAIRLAEALPGAPF